jgi:hypothetical protein
MRQHLGAGVDNNVFDNFVGCGFGTISAIPVPRGLKQEPGAPLGFIDPIFQ